MDMWPPSRTSIEESDFRAKPTRLTDLLAALEVRAMPTMIDVRDVSKRYHDHVAVDRLSFTVEEGEILGFLGPNGAGKSTTMKILTGFLPPTEGKATVAGFDVFENPLEVKRRIGYLPEQPPLYLDMTVRAYLAFVARIKGVPGKQLKSEVERCAQLTGTAEVLKRVIGNLSKGYKHRVGLAQALLNSPPVLILDEPTEGLDPRQRGEVLSLIKSLAGKHTVILSTHILPEVKATCQKVLIIHKGRIAAHDTIDTLAEKRESGLEDVFNRLTAA
jgi:ABC-2 type transport system ATP-binding protein